jgi:ribonuclease R
MSNSKRETFEEIILEILQNNPEAVLPFDVLQNILKVENKKDNKKLKEAISSLFDRNLIVKKEGGAIQLATNGKDERTPRPTSDPNKVVGKVDISRRGTGYVASDRFEEDIQISNKHLKTALQDDKVEVELFSGKGNRGRK